LVKLSHVSKRVECFVRRPIDLKVSIESSMPKIVLGGQFVRPVVSAYVPLWAGDITADLPVLTSLPIATCGEV
jgi:hypothetical protein